MQINQNNNIEKALQDDAKAFNFEPSSQILDQIVESIERAEEKHTTQKAPFDLFKKFRIGRLQPIGYALIALIAVTFILTPENHIINDRYTTISKQKMPILEKQNNLNKIIDKKFVEISGTMENKLMENMKQESKAITQDLLYFRSLMML